MRTAVSAVIRSWWLNGAARDELIAEALREIHHRQQKIVRSRNSHTKTTRKRLTERGIDLTTIATVPWNTDIGP